MEFGKLIVSRYSCRKYKSEPPSRELILKVFEAARVAPSACNRQPWKFIAVTNAEIRTRLLKAYDKEWFAGAPVIIVACALESEGWVRAWDNRNYTWVDVGIAFDHLTLAAANEGLGTCWIGAFREEAVRDALGIPPGTGVVAMTPLGFPADAKVARPRKSMGEILVWEKWA